MNVSFIYKVEFMVLIFFPLLRRFCWFIFGHSHVTKLGSNSMTSSMCKLFFFSILFVFISFHGVKLGVQYILYISNKMLYIDIHHYVFTAFECSAVNKFRFLRFLRFVQIWFPSFSSLLLLFSTFFGIPFRSILQLFIVFSLLYFLCIYPKSSNVSLNRKLRLLFLNFSLFQSFRLLFYFFILFLCLLLQPDIYTCLLFSSNRIEQKCQSNIHRLLFICISSS